MIKNYFLILATVLFWGQSSFAGFDITPIVMTLSPSGPNASISLTVTNGGDQKTPVQIAVYRRDPDVEGKEKYIDSDEIADMFQIIPSQFVLNSKEKRTVRVTYVGDPKIKEELAFRVIAEEFPINVTDATKVTTKAVASISILSKYITSLYVKPAGTSPDLSVEASLTKDNKMELIFKNNGSEHQVLQKAKYKVTTVKDKKAFALPAEAVQAIGTLNILAGKSRKFVIAWPPEIPKVPVKVTIDSTAK